MKIGIITVCLNNEDLERTIDSVLNQSFKDYDYWIIDGGSTNLITLAILEKYRNYKNLHILSEKDNGIYDAMNKGIINSTGEYLVFLNAGDLFYTNYSLSNFIKNQDNSEIIYGNLQFISFDSNWVVEYPSKLTFSFFINDTLPHPSCFIKKSLFQRVGLYESNIKITADWAFFIKALCIFNASYMHIPYTISSFYLDGISSRKDSIKLIYQEKEKFLNKHFPFILDEIKEGKMAIENLNKLKNSKIRKYLSYIFKQLAL